MSDLISRRSALKTLAGAAGALTGVAALRPATAAVPANTDAVGYRPHLTLGDPTAVALSYTDDAAKVDAAKFPTYKAGSKCDNCLQLTGTPGNTWRPCNLFPGKLVNANGWCKVYVKKT